MKTIKMYRVFIFLSVLSLSPYSQTIDAFTPSMQKQSSLALGFLDPSRLTINHSVSFGMASGNQFSDLKSQSLYSTMMTYRFSNPITVSLNIGLPIYSNFNGNANLNQKNVASYDYFRTMPIDAAVQWKPSEHFSLHFNIVRNPSYNSLYYSPFYPSLW